jgi:clan AA aspartic protease
MIRGVVNRDLEATLPLQVFGPGGQRVDVTAVIDTGYSGRLSLPMALITVLGLPPLASRVVRLADRSRKVLRTYEAEILWDGQQRLLRVLALEGDPLVGTALLEGYDLKVGFVDGGSVTLEARP